MEKYIQISTSDGFEINGVLNWKEKSDRLIIFVHGLTGGLSEAHYYCAKEYFIEKGYSVFRFNLYTDGEKTRKLKSTNISQHSEDIEAVLDYFTTSYDTLYIAGHSLAGPSLVGVTVFPKNLEKIIFWDPAFDTSSSAEKCIFENNKIFRSISGKYIEISQSMYEEFLENKHLEKLTHLPYQNTQMYIIYADGAYHIDDKPATVALGIDSFVIKGANHGFTQEGKYEELFEKTLEFIQKETGKY